MAVVLAEQYVCRCCVLVGSRITRFLAGSEQTPTGNNTVGSSRPRLANSQLGGGKSFAAPNSTASVGNSNLYSRAAVAKDLPRTEAAATL